MARLHLPHRGRWVPIVGGLLLAGACATWQDLLGPRVSGVELVPQAIEVVAADHRKRSRLRFLVVGDSGTGKADQHGVATAMLDLCRREGGCDFVLGTGDNLYDTGVPAGQREIDDHVKALFARKFESAYSAFGRLDFWMVAGNHDWHWAGTPRAEILYSLHSERWRMPALDYVVPLLPDWLTIVGLDTTLIAKGVDTGQVGRAVSALCAFPGWRILFAHHPLVSVGKHQRETELAPVREALLDDVVRRCGVDAYFAGHDHLQAHVVTPDVHLFVQGAGGRHLYDLRPSPWLPAGGERRFASKAFGFAMVDASPEELRVRFVSTSPGAPKTIYETSLAASR